MMRCDAILHPPCKRLHRFTIDVDPEFVDHFPHEKPLVFHMSLSFTLHMAPSQNWARVVSGDPSETELSL